MNQSDKPLMSARRLAEEALGLAEKAAPWPIEAWAGKGWPDALDDVLGLPAEARGVVWPICSRDTPTVDGWPATWIGAFMKHEDQAFYAACHSLVPALAEAVLQQQAAADKARAALSAVVDHGYKTPEHHRDECPGPDECGDCEVGDLINAAWSALEAKEK